MSLWGGLTSQRAVIAARLNDSETAYSQLDLAKAVALKLGEGSGPRRAPGRVDRDRCLVLL
jgi:hypothetical protein